MKNLCRKIAAISLTTLLLSFFVAPAAHAINCDQDGDGYIILPNAAMEELMPDIPYNSDGNYTPAEWQDFFGIYKKGQAAGKLTPDEICDGLNFKKGAEPTRCDNASIGISGNVFDPTRRTENIRGTEVNPGMLDKPDNGIDENCDGKDGTLISGEEKDLGSLVDNVITLLSRIVVGVSIVIMIWGGVLYATAAGDEAKTSKARKAIIGAVIGLIVGLLAPAIVNFVAANLV